MAVAISYHGEQKTGKTTFGLSAPKPMVHFDFDMGRERAIWRFPPDEQKLIYTVQLAEPPNWAIGSGAATKLWAQFDDMWGRACNDPQIKTLFADTGTQMWKANHQEYLENYVKRNKPARQQLQREEYRMPNDRMHAKLKQAIQAGKNLIISHYEAPVYREEFVTKPDGHIEKESVETPMRRHAGFGDMMYITDMHLAMYVNHEVQSQLMAKHIPHLVILTCGLVLSAAGVDMVIPDPTKGFDMVMDKVNELRQVELGLK